MRMRIPSIVGLLYHILTLHHYSNCPSVSIQTLVDLVTSCAALKSGWSDSTYMLLDTPRPGRRPDLMTFLIWSMPAKEIMHVYL